MYVYVYVYVCVYIYIYIYVCIRIHSHMFQGLRGRWTVAETTRRVSRQTRGFLTGASPKGTSKLN